MVSCGTRTSLREEASRSRECSDGVPRIRPDNLIRFAMLGLFSIALVSGCVTFKPQGSLPRTDRLETLRLGVSTKPDVLLALGKPRGHGTARFAIEPTPREIWFYEYVEVENRTGKVNILLVYFIEDKYDGHLWFSSLQELPKPN